MKRKREQQRREAEAAFDELFGALAGQDDEMFDEIVAGLNRRAVLEAAAGRLRAEYVPGDFLLYAQLFERMGFEPVAAELKAIALDASLPPAARMAALEALIGPETTLMPEDLPALLDARLREIVQLSPELPEMADAIGTMLAEVSSPEEGRELIAKLEELRAELEVPAFAVYCGALWLEGAKPLHADLVGLLAGEPSLAVRRLLGEVAEGPAAALAEEAIERLDRALAGGLPPAPGTAKLTSWRSDGIALVLERPNRDGSVRSVYVEFGGESPYAMVAPHRPAEAAMLADWVATAEIPVEEAAYLVDREFPVEGEHDDKVEIAVLLALDVARLQPPPELPAPAGSASREEVEELLDREEYGWFLTPSELEDSDVPPPEEGEDLAAWSRGALAQLQPLLAPALAGRCRFMSRWHLARGEAEDAALLARLAIDVESRFTEADLPSLMLARSLELLTPDDSRDEDEGGADEGGVPVSGRATRELLRVVSRQIAANDPPEVKRAFKRLVARGASEQDAREKLASALAEVFVEVVAEGGEGPLDGYLARVRALGRG